MLEFAKAYRENGIEMDLDVWQMLCLYPGDKSYAIVPISCPEGKYRPTIPVCRCHRGMIAVTSSGDVTPCLQMSGHFQNRGICLGNLHESRLKDIISEGPYMDAVCATVGELREKTQKCAECKWFEYCTGGCRALGIAFSEGMSDYYGADRSKCVFFENGWYEKIVEALPGWKNNTPIGSRGL